MSSEITVNININGQSVECGSRGGGLIGRYGPISITCLGHNAARGISYVRVGLDSDGKGTSYSISVTANVTPPGLGTPPPPASTTIYSVNSSMSRVDLEIHHGASLDTGARVEVTAAGGTNNMRPTATCVISPGSRTLSAAAAQSLMGRYGPVSIVPDAGSSSGPSTGGDSDHQVTFQFNSPIQQFACDVRYLVTNCNGAFLAQSTYGGSTAAIAPYIVSPDTTITADSNNNPQNFRVRLNPSNTDFKVRFWIKGGEDEYGNPIEVASSQIVVGCGPGPLQS